MESVDGDRGPKPYESDVSYTIRRGPLNIAQFVLDVVEVYVPAWELPADIDGGVSDVCGCGSS